VFDSTRATSNAAFTLNRIVNGTTVTPIGAVTITPASNTSATLTGAGGTLAVGDVLQLIAPAQDATLSDVGITLLCSRI
jgi:predicted phage tail protein